MSLSLIEKMRWGDRTRCAYCDSVYTERIKESLWGTHHCKTCNTEFSVISNTLFKRTNLNPIQLYKLLCLVKDKQLNRRPGELSKIVGVHHWTMTKIIRRIGDLLIYDILNVPPIVVFEDFLNCMGADRKGIPYMLFSYLYKMTSQDPYVLSYLLGMRVEKIQEIISRIKKCWISGEEFLEKDKKYDWFVWDNWEKNPMGIMITLNIHAMCLDGTIKRDPIAEVYSINE